MPFKLTSFRFLGKSHLHDNKAVWFLYLLTDDADTNLIRELLCPLHAATIWAISDRDTLSGPPTFTTNRICWPP